MTIDVYYSKYANSYSVVEPQSKNITLLEFDAKRITAIIGEDWNDCMKQYHEYMGWEPYKPEEDECTNSIQ